MKPAQYAVVRYVADPARNEPINVGIVVWTELTSSFRLEPTALERVVRENPHLDKDSLLYLDPFLRQTFAPERPLDGPQTIERRLREQRLFPVVFSEPRFTTAADGSEGALEAALDRLLIRVVRPPKRRGGGRRLGAEDALAKRWKPWLGREILRNHVFGASRSGNPRKVSFYANSGANVAVDVLRLAIQKGDEIVQRADAEAFKIEDITAAQQLQFIVHCDLQPGDEYSAVNETALRSIASVGAVVATELDDVAERLEAALSVG